MELLYFQSADLLIRVDYNEDTNSLRYWSNREMEFKERTTIEQYLLKDFASRVGYYERLPSLFEYMGIESDLSRELSLLHLENMLKYLSGKEQRAEQKVKEVINVSMTNYYFEQIGDEILALRGEVKNGCCPKRIRDVKVRMSELLSAYNLHSNQQLTLEEVVPADLRDYL